MSGQFVLQMAGYPASGKSTVARSIKKATGAVLIDKDVIKSAMLQHGIPEETAAPLAYQVFFEVGRSIAVQGDSVIFDSPAYFKSISENGQSIAEEALASYFIIECVCSNEAELLRRLTSRMRMASQIAHIMDPYSRPGAAPLTKPRLELDTCGDMEVCIAEALRYVGA